MSGSQFQIQLIEDIENNCRRCQHHFSGRQLLLRLQQLQLEAVNKFVNCCIYKLDVFVIIYKAITSRFTIQRKILKYFKNTSSANYFVSKSRNHCKLSLVLRSSRGDCVTVLLCDCVTVVVVARSLSECMSVCQTFKLFLAPAAHFLLLQGEVHLNTIWGCVHSLRACALAGRALELSVYSKVGSLARLTCWPTPTDTLSRTITGNMSSSLHQVLVLAQLKADPHIIKIIIRICVGKI